MAKGDIVPITFPFTDLSGSKLRPAVVISDNSLDLYYNTNPMARINRRFTSTQYGERT